MAFHLILLLYLGSALALSAGNPRQAQSVTAPVDGRLEVPLKGTERLPSGRGVAILQSHPNNTGITVALHGMRPARLFGGDLNTYVVWLIEPDGTTHNAGEMVLNGRHSELTISARSDRFGIIVTAEPHYLVDMPSRFVVFEIEETKQPAISYRGFDGSYSYERDSLEETKHARGPVETAVGQAVTAVRLAGRSKASLNAERELGNARRSLQETLDMVRANGDREKIESHARQTIRLAVAAQRQSETTP